jgi:hypothetical protein
VLVLAAACGSKQEDPASTGHSGLAGHAEAAGAVPADPVSPPGPPDFPEGTRSLQMIRMAPVRLVPADDGKRIGTVAVDTRVGWIRTTQGKGCAKPWVEIRPRGWVCGENMKPVKLAPYGREVPVLDRGEIVPGTYGRVTDKAASIYRLEQPAAKKPAKKPAKNQERPVTSPSQLDRPPKPEPRMIEDKPVFGSLTVRQYGEVTVGGKTYWRVSQRGNEYILKSAIRQLAPSQRLGTRLADDTGLSLPIAFVWPRNGWQKAWTHAKPNAYVKRQLDARTPVAILEVAEGKDGKPAAYRIGESEWMHPADLRIFEPVAPPPLLGPNERWIDIDLDKQMLVAFEGELPVYAAMISSGAKETPTQTGLYRVWLKESESDMKNLKSEDPYSVATVPWTQFFSPQHELAIHTAYWHDGFGRVRSHGCVNLAPRDARWLYFWSDPQVPPGWTMAAGLPEAPGSIVRVRSKDDPQPETKEYAKKVEDARRRNAPIR